MVIELPKERYREVRPLFKEMSYLNIYRSHLERTPIEKQVYVDDLENPQTAVIVVLPRLFFGGKADNSNFNSSLRKFLFGELKEKYIARGNHEVDCYYANKDWEKHISNILIEPFFYKRYYYEIEELKFPNWREFLPAGFSIHPVDLTLLSKNHLINYEWLIEEIKENWLPFETHLEENKGFYILKDNQEIVSWCTLEYLTDENEIEVGIATRSEYRKLGLAIIVGSATAEYALSKYKSVGWNCSAGNIGSVKTAEKIGYRVQAEYVKAGCFFNIVDNWHAHGYTQARMKQYESAIHWYGKVVEAYQSNNPETAEAVIKGDAFPLNRVIFRIATFYSAINKKKEAFANLRDAIKNGFNNKSLLEEDELLVPLHTEEEWKDILQLFNQ